MAWRCCTELGKFLEIWISKIAGAFQKMVTDRVKVFAGDTPGVAEVSLKFSTRSHSPFSRSNSRKLSHFSQFSIFSKVPKILKTSHIDEDVLWRRPIHEVPAIPGV